MQSINKIDVWSASKMAGIIFAVIGLVMAILIIILLFAGVGLLNSILGSASGAGKTLIEGTSTAVISLITLLLIPIFFAFFGMISTMIFTAIYNSIASLFGGVQVDLGR